MLYVVVKFRFFSVYSDFLSDQSGRSAFCQRRKEKSVDLTTVQAWHLTEGYACETEAVGRGWLYLTPNGR